MKPLIFLMILSYGCAQVSPRESPNHVSVEVALDQAQMSYLKGCVETHKELNLAPSFPLCKERAKTHRSELNEVMNGKIINLN